MSKARVVLRTIAAAVTAASAAALYAVPASGQAAAAREPAAASRPKYAAPRTADGHPDLQGVWSFATITPLERPTELADKAVLTPEEAAAWEKQGRKTGRPPSRASSASTPARR